MKVIPGFSGYGITDDREVFNLTTLKRCKPYNAKGSMAVSVWSDEGKRLTRVVANLYLLAFPIIITTQDTIYHEAGSLEGRLFTKEREQLRKYITYNQETGAVTLVNGKPIGWREVAGYHVMYWKGATMKVHRLIFIYMLGYIPEGQVDHIDRDRSNNTWTNLRMVSNTTNQRNTNKRKDNTSGMTGITWREGTGKWRARIMLDGRSITLGSFVKKEEAIAAREEANKRYGFL